MYNCYLFIHVSDRATCVAQADCEMTDDNCRREWHCVDGLCRCGLGITNWK